MKRGMKPAVHLDGYLNAKEISKFLDCHLVTLNLFKRDGRLPPPDKIVGCAFYWSESIIPQLKATFGIGK